MDRWSFTLCSNFPTAMNRLFGNRAKACQITAGLWTASVRPGDGDKVDFPCASGGERPVLQLLSSARVKCVVIDKQSDVRLRNQASVTEQDVRKRLMCHLPVFLPYHNR